MQNALVDLSKLRLTDGAILYKVRQQDGTFQAMQCPDTTSNRLFVSWLQVHDGKATKTDGKMTNGKRLLVSL